MSSMVERQCVHVRACLESERWSEAGWQEGDELATSRQCHLLASVLHSK